MIEAALAEQAEHCLLSPEMAQLFFRPVVCICDPALPVLKDILLLAGQRVCPFQTLLIYCCFFPSLVFLRRFVARNRRSTAPKKWQHLGVCGIWQS